MPSEKTVVIDYLWDLLQAEGNSRRMVYRDDVVKAIEHCQKLHGITLSTGNPANFMKDVVRGDNASGFWPERLTKMQIGGRQRPGDMRVLEFIPFVAGQTEPFPNKYMPHPGLDPIQLQSVSLAMTSKSLGRKDESWLIQVAVNLRVIENHFAVRSPLNVQEFTHLQIGVKLSTSEVDSLFLAILQNGDGQLSKALVTCEAKQEGQRILEHQLVEQVVAANKSVKGLDLGIEFIVPIAIKAIPPKGQIYIAEFKAWTPAQAEVEEDLLGELELVSEGLYQLLPPVRGIGYVPQTKRRKK